ncbi:MAG: hypothetical protein WC374_05565 [Phycisphaerae bacterium]|jgi:hypothetical protein
MQKRIITICTILAVTVCSFSAFGKPASTDSKQVKSDTTGPTVLLDYETDNSVASFMYFVPMISTVLVESQSSPQNTQRTRIISSKRTSNNEEFKVECVFEMWGKGYHENQFDAEDIIANDTDFVPQGKPFKNIIEYIRFEGTGQGRIEVTGKKINGTEQVTKVVVYFNHNDNTSPVTVGLYDMKPKDGQYKFEDRSGIKTARVNVLTFENNQFDPRMGIQLASLGGKTSSDGFIGRLKGRIANMFIEPIKVNPQGNQAMLDFGYALYQKQAKFTFPLAENLKVAKEQQETQTVVAKTDAKTEIASTKSN